jgi:hypothetical protein
MEDHHLLESVERPTKSIHKARILCALSALVITYNGLFLCTILIPTIRNHGFHKEAAHIVSELWTAIPISLLIWFETVKRVRSILRHSHSRNEQIIMLTYLGLGSALGSIGVGFRAWETESYWFWYLVEMFPCCIIGLFTICIVCNLLQRCREPPAVQLQLQSPDLTAPLLPSP